MSVTIYIVLAVIGWSTWAIFNKLALNHIHPFAVQFVAALVCIPLSFIYYNFIPKDMKWDKAGIAWAAIAACVTFGGSCCYMFAASQKEVSTVIGFTALYPALTFLLAVVFLGETFTANKFIGLLLVLAGVWVLKR